VPSDEGEDMEEDDNDDGDDEDRQIRILQETTGMPREAFDGKLVTLIHTGISYILAVLACPHFTVAEVVVAI
jgi:hypothetical protein